MGIELIKNFTDSILCGQNIILFIKDTISHIITIIDKKEETSLTEKILENSITVVLALTAGLVALYQVKSNIVSTARIKWIEETRQDISQLYNESLGTILYWTNFKLNNKPEDYNKYDISHSNFFILSNRIRMRLNIKEDRHLKLERILNDIEIMLDPDNIEKHKQEDIEIKLKEVVKLSREIFKIEWDKSKKIFTI